MKRIRVFLLLLTLALLPVLPAAAEELPNALNLYWGRMTTNEWEELFNPGEIEMADSSLVALALARKVAEAGDWLSFEVEGQLARHYGGDRYWEVVALGGARWEPFWWDRYVDTSLAFGLGASYATRRPQVEIDKDGDTERLLAYWMVEIAVSLPQYPQLALIGRLHHRSGAYGLFADEGGSTAPAVGLKYRF
jgi:hypothetical protein